jgi:hypothetical protein
MKIYGIPQDPLQLEESSAPRYSRFAKWRPVSGRLFVFWLIGLNGQEGVRERGDEPDMTSGPIGYPLVPANRSKYSVNVKILFRLPPVVSRRMPSFTKSWMNPFAVAGVTSSRLPTSAAVTFGVL